MPEESKPSDNQIGEVLELVKTYVKQETVGPLRGAGRWIGFGVGGALSLGLGGFFVVLGVLRLFQTELSDTFDGNLSILPYVIVLILAAIVVGLAVGRIGKDTLQRKEPGR